MTHSSTPVPVLDIDLIDSLRADLGASEWTVDRISAALSATATDAMMRGMRVPALLELAGSRDPAAVLTRFFMLGADDLPGLRSRNSGVQRFRGRRPTASGRRPPGRHSQDSGAGAPV